MVTLIANSPKQFNEWIDRLDGLPYPDEQKPTYTLTVPNDEKTLIVEQNVANWLVDDRQPMPPPLEAPKPKPSMMSQLVFLFCVLLFFAWAVGLFDSSDDAPPSFATWQEHRHYHYGEDSDYRFKLAHQVHQNYLTNPSTGVNVDYRLILVERDSMTIVMGFQGDNDFGVTKQHSITMVADSLGNIARVLSFQ